MADNGNPGALSDAAGAPEDANATAGGPENSAHPDPRQHRYLEPSPHEADGGHLVGLDPRRISVSDLRGLGHPESPIKAIRAKCLDCCCGSEGEVRKCVQIDCPVWPYRMGKNVFHSRAGKRR